MPRRFAIEAAFAAVGASLLLDGVDFYNPFPFFNPVDLLLLVFSL